MHDRKKYVSLFSGALGLGLMHTIFSFYYVKVFLQVFQVNEFWFTVAQSLFMIWNAINDPLFGYIQDLGGTWMKDRSKIFTYFGPFLVVSFLILWVPWRSNSHSPVFVEGFHLIVGLFLYDAFFSCIGVAWSALYADSTREHRKRVKALKYSQFAILCSVSVISIAEKASHSLDNFFGFQVVCTIIGCISMLLFYIAGRLGRSPSLEKYDKLIDSSSETEKLTWSNIRGLTWQLLTAKDFLVIVATNFIHICRAVSHLNFASIATDILVPQNVLAKGSWQISIFFAVCTFVPQIIVVSNERLMVTNGAYRLMMFSFISSILSAVMYFFSWSPYVIMFFMFVDSINVHSISPLMNILLAEFIEDDTARHNRKTPLSSLIFSFNALITKPAISIAPVLIVYLLNRNGYEGYQKDHIRSEELQWCMLRIIFTIPFVLGLLEFLIFRKYSLRNRHSNPGLPI